MLKTIHEGCRDADPLGLGGCLSSEQTISPMRLTLRAAMLWQHMHEVALHSYRVSQCAYVLAHQVGLSDEESTLIARAGVFHDIGKVYIPTPILDKPSPLTSEEWVMMRTHARIGSEMLLRVGGMGEQLAPLVAAHHECWDGSGYPNGVKGNDIPQGARLLAVADAYDAMCSERPYRKPLDGEAIRAEVQRGAGHQFDPQVCELLLHLLDEEPDMFALSRERTVVPCGIKKTVEPRTEMGTRGKDVPSGATEHSLIACTEC